MRIARLHRWDLDYAAAVRVQRELAGGVEAGPPLEEVETIAGADVSGGKKDEWIVAAVVVVRWPKLEVVEVRQAAARAAWPYVPGCLSFREVPALAEAFRLVREEPDLVLCDGQGLAHPRRMGLACHVGLVLGVPTIGCAKSRLLGDPAGELGRERGSRVPLMDGAERIGTVLRTRTGTKPVYVSVGHRIDLASAERWVLASAPRFRLPEPIRLAHQVVTHAKRELVTRAGTPRET